MSTSCDPDQQFHNNLRLLGRRIEVPEGLSQEVRSRCAAALDPTRPTAPWRIVMKKQTLLSITGIAAAIAVAAEFFFPGNGAPTVQAATIIQKLSEQIEQSPLFEVTLDSLEIEQVSINGRLQASQHAAAGHIHVKVQEGQADEFVEVDLSLALSNDGGWVLIRKLIVSDPAAQAIVALVFPPETETLILLPEDASEFDDVLDIDVEMGDARSELKHVLDELLASHEDYGVTLERQEDGMLLLTLPINDAETLAALGRLAQASPDAKQTQGVVTVTESGVETEEKKAGLEVEIDDGGKLIGTTITMLYDPVAEQVRSFSILDLGSPGSRITVTIGEGEVDPALLDSSRLTTPATRTFDLGALKSLLEDLD
jgi:hypothetical protein